MEQIVWRMMMAAAVLPIKFAIWATRALFRSISNHRVENQYGAASAGPASILYPGAGPPPPGADYLDYRGLASAVDVQALWNQAPYLGRYFDCQSQRSKYPLGIPANLLFRHAAVVGPAGSGKTASVIIPWTAALLRLGCSVVAIDVKGDLLDNVQSHVAMSGGPTGADLYVWDFSGNPTHRWNWLDEVSDTASVEAAVTSILGRPNAADPQLHFYRRDVRWLRALIRLTKEVHGHSATPQHLVRACSSNDELGRAVGRVRQDPSIASDLSDATSLDAATYSQALAGLMNALSVFSLPEVAHASSASDFTISELTRTPSLLMCVAPQANANLSASMSSLLITQVVQSVYRNFGKNLRPVFLVLDESPRLRDRVNLEELVSLARSANVGICLAAQEITQFPESERSSLFNNCQTFIAMPGVSPETARYLEARLGSRPIPQTSISKTGGALHPTPAATTQSSIGPVLGAREIMHPPFGPFVAVAHVPPVTSRPFLVDVQL